MKPPSTRTHDTAAPAARRPALPVDAQLSPLFEAVSELKRTPASHAPARSLADAGFRMAWSSLSAGDDVDSVALTQLALAAAHVSLGSVDGAALAGAGLDAHERRTVYRRASARALGPITPALAARVDAIADGLSPGETLPRFAAILCDRPCAAALGRGPQRVVITPEEMQSERGWTVGVIAGLIQLRRGHPPGPAVLLGLAAQMAHAYDAAAGTGTDGDDAPGGGGDALKRSLDECPPDLARTIRARLATIGDLTDDVAGAVLIADVVDRVLQTRHYANRAGFSLSDAVDVAAFVRPGPAGRYQYDALVRLGLTF